MATGSSFQDLSLQFYRGASTIGIVVRLTCEAIWSHLQPMFMAEPKSDTWKNIAQRYFELWNLPNCIGSIDGKHIRVKCFNNTGSTYFNYKGYFSMVLMAVADADGCFTVIDVGEFGRNSDGAVFRKSVIGQLLKQGKLNVPDPTPLPRDTNVELFPHYLVGDEAFPLLSYLMRPYPKRVLTDAKRIFNFRLSRGRKSVECAFGMLISKFRVFERPISCNEECAVNVIKAACILNNFIRNREGKFYDSTDFKTCDILPVLADGSELDDTIGGSPAVRLRNRLGNYFLQPEGAIPIQWKYAGVL